MLTGSPHAIEHGSSRTGRWLAARRVRFSIWIAVLEAIVVLFSHDLTKWTVIALAAVCVLAYALGRGTRSQTLREVLWILAVSQCIATVAVVLGFIVKWALITAIVIGAVLGLIFLFLDRRAA